MNNKKYQVFVSSTFKDLKEERKKILDVLLMADCIPAGMEAFVANDVEQFEVIKKVINLCDYYVLIIGKCYGTLHPETRISYTEMEYDYAIQENIPVLVFVIDDNVKLDKDKVDTDKEKIDKLGKFRIKVMTNRLVSIWKTTDDLMGKLAVSIMKAKTEIERPGWQRAVDFDEASLRREIMELKDKNDKLSNDLLAANDTISSLTEQTDIAFENKSITMKYYYYDGLQERYCNKKIGLVDFFETIATEMMDVSITESRIEEVVICQHLNKRYTYHLQDNQFIKKLLNQYKALGLIYSSWSSKNKDLYWGVTAKGKKVRDDMILIRNGK